MNGADTPPFTVTQLIHAQDRYFDLSGRQSESPCCDKVCSDVRVPSPRADGEAFRVLGDVNARAAAVKPVVLTPKRKKESSFAILAETPLSRPTSPRSLPVDIRSRRVSPFRGRGFREETSRHNTPKTSTSNSRANSPPRRRTHSLSRIDNMAQTATLPLPIHTLPRNFLKENIEGVREISELNRERNEAEAERKRIEQEQAILKEMGLLDKNKSGSRSVVGSRTNSRSNSPGKIKLRSRSSSPAAIMHYESIISGSREYINIDEGLRKPVTHKSRIQSISKSQPTSNDVSPKHSKIPKRQGSVSPPRPSSKREIYIPKRPIDNSLNKNQRFISNSASSIHETIRIGSQVHDKRASQSTQQLSISPAHIMGKPPISPGRGGPPPTNKTVNTKRLSPIVGTPNKSPTDDAKPSSTKTSVKPSVTPKKPVKTAGSTPATSRLNSRQPSRAASREPSPEKNVPRKTKPVTKPNNTTTATNNSTKPSTIKTASTKPITQKPPVPKPEPKKPISRTSSIKSLTRTPSSKNMYEKPPLKRGNTKNDLLEKAQSTNKSNEVARKNSVKDTKGSIKGKPETVKVKSKMEHKDTSTDSMESESVAKQDNETQYDKHTNEKNELVILTKKNIISMTTAAITSQPLEVVTKVTNQLPAAFEKAREKGIFERLSSKDSLVGKEELTESEKQEKDKDKQKDKEKPKEKESKKQEHKITQDHKKPNDDEHEDKKSNKHPKNTFDKNNQDKNHVDKNHVDKNHVDKNHMDKNHQEKYILESKPSIEDNIRLRLLQPPYNNPQVERVKQKIEAILKEPEVSTENILTASAKSRELKEAAEKKKTEVKEEVKDEVSNKLTDMKDQINKQNEKMTEEIRTEVTKIVDSIITPVEQPKDILEKPKDIVETPKDIIEKPKVIPEQPKYIPEKPKDMPEKPKEIKKDIIEPIVTVVNEKKKTIGSANTEKVNETLVKGEVDVDLQSSNVSTPGIVKIEMEKKIIGESNGSDLSSHSNGGLPQSTSTTPKPPIRTKRSGSKDADKSLLPELKPKPEPTEVLDPVEVHKDPNFCQRVIKKCKSKCCTCCPKDDSDDEREKEGNVKEKKISIANLNCLKKSDEEMGVEDIKDMERAAGKASIEYETETKRSRKFRDILCGCCGRRRRVADTGMVPRNVADSMSPAPEETGCCGTKRRPERRDSILSDRQTTGCCNNRVGTWLRGICRRQSEHSSSRRTSMFSKNKSMSPTLPPEDNRKKLDTSLVEHTSVMRGAIPVLPIVLAFFCFLCNIIIPGLGTIFSGMFCLCFGIPRFGVHDGAKHRIGSFVINLLVGCGQLFTVLFCLVGWGWSIWWGVIMIKISRKYRKLKREAAAVEAEAAPPVTANNHTRA